MIVSIRTTQEVVVAGLSYAFVEMFQGLEVSVEELGPFEVGVIVGPVRRKETTRYLRKSELREFLVGVLRDVEHQLREQGYRPVDGGWLNAEDADFLLTEPHPVFL